MLTCQELTELITDYLEGRLPLGRRLAFQMHVGMCRHCRAYLREMKLVVRAAAALPLPSPPPEVRAELLMRLRDWKQRGA